MAVAKKRCKYCKEYKPVGDGKQLPIGWVCCIEHGLLLAQEIQKRNNDKKLVQAFKVQTAKANQDKKVFKARKAAIKPKSKLLAEAQASVNKYIRTRDFNKPCISCESESVTVFGGYIGACGWDAGHFRSRASAPQLRFNVLNIHRQCVKCNRFKSGNAVDYRIKLIGRIGVDSVEVLENNNGVAKFSVDYLNRLKKIFNKKARYYEKRRCN